MTDPLLAGFVVFLTNPTFGIPFLLLTGALLAWLLWEPAVPLYASETRRTFHPSDADGVSRSFYALRTRQYSRLVLDAIGRLDTVLRARHGVDLASVPRRGWPDVDGGLQVKLHDLKRRSAGVYAQARSQEPGASAALGFWRLSVEGRRHVRERLERFLLDCDYLTVQFGSPP